jgi:hypothetical protein
MEKLFTLFEKCEDKRHQRETETNPEFFEPERGKNYYKLYHNNFIKKLSNHKFGKTTPSGENLDAMINYNLSSEEASIVYMYTHHNIYNKLNYNLRENSQNLDEDIKEYTNLLNLSLEKLPSVNETTLYRDIRYPENGVAHCLKYYKNNIGNVLSFNDFLSCHTDDVIISDKKTDFQFVIKTSKNSNAKDIQQLTLINLEKEILFKNMSFFLIEKVDRKNNQVYMSEI